MADIPLQNYVFTDAALTPATAAAAAGDTVEVNPGDRVIVEVTNGSGASINVTIPANPASLTVQGVGVVTIPNRVVAIPAGQTRRIGPIPQGYVDSATRRAAVNYSATTTVTRAAFRVPEPA